MQESKTVSNFSANTTKTYGTEIHNYSVDQLKKAAFFNEIQRIQSYPELIENSVDRNTILCYLKDRVDDISKRYK
jgi:hypothetical protein